MNSLISILKEKYDLSPSISERKIKTIKSRLTKFEVENILGPLRFNKPEKLVISYLFLDFLEKVRSELSPY